MVYYKNLCALLVLGVLSVFGSLSLGGEAKDGLRGGLAKTKAYEHRKEGIHDGNKIVTIFYNFGGIGNGTITPRVNSGIYPRGSGHSYIYEFSPVIGAEAQDIYGNTIHIFSDGMVDTRAQDLSPEGIQWGFEPLPGYANPDQDHIAMSDDPTSWPALWPDRLDEAGDPGWPGVWDGEYGKYARANQESYFRMNDYYNDEFAFYPDSSDSSKRGLALEVAVRGYQWAHVLAEDIIIWVYKIYNTGQTHYDKMIFGMYGDADVGDAGDVGDDDSWFDIEDDMVYQWDHDNRGDWGGPPAYFGWKYLESPGDPTDGVDNDGDGLPGADGNPWDESQDDGIDNDGDWNPDTDDIGSDGLGPLDPDYPGPDPDGTEGNGVPDRGEPNFEHTDNDESDQIGLTSFNAAPWPTINPSHDDDMWSRTHPGWFSEILQTVDITFLYAAAYFPLPPGEWRKFSIALLFGEDLNDIIRNALTMQNIYDSDYNFAKPPLKPNVTAVPGDHKVTLYWDQIAEQSRDPIYGYDFEGYTIYRSTEPAFLEGWIITDMDGIKTFNKPIAQFDLADSLMGAHPQGISGAQFQMGHDTGLMHSWTDTTVENGQTYYYAVCSYDKGYDDDFYQRGLSDRPNLPPIPPAECTRIIETDESGRVVSVDNNTVMITPDAPAAGYVPPENMSVQSETITHIMGIGTGDIRVNILDPLKAQEEWEYEILFEDSAGTNKSYTVWNRQWLTETFLADTIWMPLRRKHFVPDSVVVSEVGGEGNFVQGVDYLVDYEKGNIKALFNGSMTLDQSYQIAYQYYPVYQSSYLDGEDNNPYFQGLQILVYDETDLVIDPASLVCIVGNSNYRIVPADWLNPYRDYANPADYEIRFLGTHADTGLATGHILPFRIWNTTDQEYIDVRVASPQDSTHWSFGDHIYFYEYIEDLEQNKYTWIVDILPPDTTADTTLVTIPPDSGDVFQLKTLRPFNYKGLDVFSFTTEGAKVDQILARSELDQVAVVPNPYVVTASWEPQHFYTSGRGQRKIDFIHLPAQCTIKIFTIRGFLVDTIKHHSSLDDGSESWDLISKDGMEVAYGIYIYYLDAPGLGQKIGKFAVIK